ncbi:fimbria/pilus outer membrane usher protein [Utexia brackfieldae]|uniref:fimbria/pilus outer membrane usher protein n=1 Tax=Utexia brackfieldae TaxID=3074108 RepID=UPI00370D73CA
MKCKKLSKKHHFKLSMISLSLIGITPAFSTYADETEAYEFNSGFIIGKQRNIDLSRFNKEMISAGLYSVDVYTNNQWKGRYDLNISKDNNGHLGVCYTPKMLEQFGISIDKLNNKLAKEKDFCQPLSAINSDKNVQDVFIPSQLRLNISIPQIYELTVSRAYIEPIFWDQGITALNVSYMGNYYYQHFSSTNNNYPAHHNNNAYVSINGGLSSNGWLLKHVANASWQNSNNIEWNNTQTYLQKALPQIKSKAIAGNFYTDGNLFDSIHLRGMKLSTDSDMFPDGMTSYAPEIRGIAQSNALVIIRQNGTIIYQTSVPPGPFNLTDVHPTGYGSDLDVTVLEADGSESTFSVPYSSIAQLLRPGYTHYQVALGKSEVENLTKDQTIYLGTIRHGLNSRFTLYAGTTGFNEYHSILLGTAINTGFGALAFDINYAHLSLFDNSHIGQSYRLNFNRKFVGTNTNIFLAASHSPTKHYYNLHDALYAVEYQHQENYNPYRSPIKNDFNFTINQHFSDTFGGIYAAGRIAEYWENDRTVKQFQVTYSNTIKRLSFSSSYMRVYTKHQNENKIDDRISFNLTYPLGLGGKSNTLTSNTTFNNTHFGSSQLGINGLIDKDGLGSYGVNTSISSGGQKNVAINTSYRSKIAAVSSNFSQGETYRQFGFGTSGSLVIHTDGMTLSPNISETMVLVEAKGAQGATMLRSPNTFIDSKGYALSPYARPYRINTIEVDPKGSPEDVEFSNNLAHVVPYAGSITKVIFDVKRNQTRVFYITHETGEPLPFGYEVKDSHDKPIGIVGQGGTVFIHNPKADSAIIEWDNGRCIFQLDNQPSNDRICYDQIL